MAVQKKIALKRLAANIEAAFSTAITAFSGGATDYYAVPAIEPEFTPSTETIPVPVETGTLGHHWPSTIGGKGGSVAFRTPIPGAKTAPSGATEADEWEWLDYLMAGSGMTSIAATTAKSAGASLVATGTSAAQFDVTGGEGSRFVVGDMIAVETTNADAWEVRYVTAVSTDTISVGPNLSAAPTVGGSVFGLVGYTLSDTDPGTISFAAEIDGLKYWFTGCKGTWKITNGTARAMPTLEWTFQVDSWTRSGPSGTFPTLSTFKPIKALSSPFAWGDTVTVAGKQEFDPGLEVQSQPSTAGAAGRANQWITNTNARFMVDVWRSASASDAHQTDYEAATEREILVQLGSGTGNTGLVAVFANKAQIMEYPVETDLQGLASLPLDIRANYPQSTTIDVWVVAFGLT